MASQLSTRQTPTPQAPPGVPYLVYRCKLIFFHVHVSIWITVLGLDFVFDSIRCLTWSNLKSFLLSIFHKQTWLYRLI